VPKILLTTVFAAIARGQHLQLLLPDFPFQAGEMPSLILRAKAQQPYSHTSDSTVDQPNDADFIRLLSYATTRTRSFLLPAENTRFRVPNMPGVSQFFLVDANPELEARFAVHNTTQPRHILFHGTRMDRLFGILAHGLKIQSNTALKANGAVHGPGIYLSNDPGTAWGYAHDVILGCEHAGDVYAKAIGNVRVVTNEDKLMVRYVFIVPRGSSAPRVQDVRPAMLSACDSLRLTAPKNSYQDAAVVRRRH
jgi:hypothetical protein